MFATVRVVVDVDRDRLVHRGRSRAPAARAGRSPSRTAGAFTFGALTTTLAGRRRAGERLLHPVVGLDDRRATAGTCPAPASPCAAAAPAAASASSSPPARTADRAGRRRTRSTIAPQTRPSPSPRASRPTNGTRARSTLSPSLESSAGRTVSEPSTAIGDDERSSRRRTTRTSRRRSGTCPAIATITVSPEISTERPEVAAAASSAARSLRPGGPLLAFALQVEHRVVDADREPDQEHHRGRLHRDRQERGSAARSGRTSRRPRSARAAAGSPRPRARRRRSRG